MRVRRAHAADAAAVGDVIVAAGRAAWTDIFDTSRMTQDAPLWASLIADAERFWVAEAPSGRLVGFSAAGPATDPGRGAACGELLMLHVHPDAWGAGVAVRLHDVALFHLRRSGRTTAVLRTEERNHRALAFYARRGWAPDGTALERELQGSRLREPWLLRELAGPDVPRVRDGGQPALALGDDPPRATLAYDVRGEVCHLLGLRVETPGRGDGTRLIDAVAEVATGAGCRALRVRTTPGDTNAPGFYQRRGFAPRDALELERPLGAAP